MNVMVTGGRGFIGSFLVGLLVGRGDHVTIVSRTPDRLRTARANVTVAPWLPPLEGFDVTGGTAPDRVRAALAAARERLGG